MNITRTVSWENRIAMQHRSDRSLVASDLGRRAGRRPACTPPERTDKSSTSDEGKNSPLGSLPTEVEGGKGAESPAGGGEGLPRRRARRAAMAEGSTSIAEGMGGERTMGVD